MSHLVLNEVAVEEERVPHFHARDFFPVRADTIYGEKYRTITKLGFGGNSTVWLAQNLNFGKEVSPSESVDDNPFAVIKFRTSDYEDQENSEYELGLYQRFAAGDPLHPGVPYIHSPEESFEVVGPAGTHICLVFPPMRANLSQYQCSLKNKRLPLYVFKIYLVSLLHGLDYLHSQARVIHADLNLHNILVTIEDDSIIEDFVRTEANRPEVCKVVDNYPIYHSRDQFGPVQIRKGPIVPVIADFGHAQCLNDKELHINPIQSDRYRAPEVLLGTGWGPSADIWNLGVMLWNMLDGVHTDLFTNIYNSDGNYSASRHLASIIALLGPPPAALIAREQNMRVWNFTPELENSMGKICKKVYEFYDGPFFDSEGKFLYPDLISHSAPKIQDTISALDGEEKNAFLDFVCKNMLCWDPDERMTARQLLRHPWLVDIELPWQ